MGCMKRDCPDCGDALIHLNNRGPHESSSAFGQFMHDNGERERAWREMYWMDVDGIIFKSRTSMLRIIEHKPHIGSLSAGQKVVLPLLAKMVQMLASTGLVHAQSGVFVLNSDPPHDEILVTQVKGWPSIAIPRPINLSGSNLEDFLCGEPVNLAIEPPSQRAA